MKVSFTLFIALLFISCHLKAQTGIGTTSPHPSAKLDITSTDKGFLPPRMTSAQRAAISNPTAGLMVYQTDGNSGLYYYGGSSWIYIINSSTNVLPVANGGTGVSTSTGSGNVVLSNSPTLETPTISSGNTQYPSSIVINPTTNVTSKRAAIWMGNWGLLQDFNGDGTQNFSMTQNYSGTYPTRFFIDTEGKVGIGNSVPTEKLEVSGNVKATNFIGNGDQLSNIATKGNGSWNLSPGDNNVSITVAPGHSYSMWINGNIPNGIALWNATVTTANTNVPVLGTQFAWHYVAGNALLFLALPDQIIGINDTIVDSPQGYPPNTSNVFKFILRNNSGSNQVIYWGYTKL
jgi:hypothetical protein